MRHWIWIFSGCIVFGLVVGFLESRRRPFVTTISLVFDEAALGQSRAETIQRLEDTIRGYKFRSLLVKSALNCLDPAKKPSWYQPDDSIQQIIKTLDSKVISTEAGISSLLGLEEKKLSGLGSRLRFEVKYRNLLVSARSDIDQSSYPIALLFACAFPDAIATYNAKLIESWEYLLPSRANAHAAKASAFARSTSEAMEEVFSERRRVFMGIADVEAELNRLGVPHQKESDAVVSGRARCDENCNEELGTSHRSDQIEFERVSRRLTSLGRSTVEKIQVYDRLTSTLTLLERDLELVWFRFGALRTRATDIHKKLTLNSIGDLFGPGLMSLPILETDADGERPRQDLIVRDGREGSLLIMMLVAGVFGAWFGIFSITAMAMFKRLRSPRGSV